MNISHIPNIVFSPDSLNDLPMVRTLQEADFIAMTADLLVDQGSWAKTKATKASTSLVTPRRALNMSVHSNGLKVWFNEDRHRSTTLAVQDLRVLKELLSRVSRVDIHVAPTTIYAELADPQPAFEGSTLTSSRDDNDIPF